MDRAGRRERMEPPRRQRAAAQFWDRLITLGPRDEASLHVQIRQGLVAAILDGTLQGNTRLPSSRDLARQLGVARNTVSLAYDQLANDGLIQARPRSGYRVMQLAQRAGRAASPASAAPGAPAWAQRIGPRFSALRNISKPPDWYQYPFSFIYGQPDPDLFPTADWRECSRAALAVLSIRDWSADMIDGDDAELIEQLQRRVLPERGIFVSPDQIMITVGSQNALYMLAELLITPQSVVGIEDPGYPDARNIFTLRGATLRPVPAGVRGAALMQLQGCDIAYLTPSHQCPTSSTMSFEDRHALLDHAARHDLLIIEDDYECELRFDGAPAPALKSLDRAERVLYLGSLSKTLAPGLRIGFMVGAQELIVQARILRRLMLRHPPANNQRATALFISLGHYDALLRRQKENLAGRAAVLTAALRAYAPGLAFAPPCGGSSLWVRGPDGLDARRLAEIAAPHGILIEPGDMFFHVAAAPCPYFRLGYSSIPKERIPAGIQKLAALLPAVLNMTK